MIWLIGSLAYGLAGLVVWRMLAGHLAWFFLASYKREWPSLARDAVAPSGEQWFGATCAAFCAALVWPLVLLFVRIPVPAIGAEARARQRARDERIAQLEKELGI